MTKEEILEIFDGIATILQIRGEDPGKVKMYRGLVITLATVLPDEIDNTFDVHELSKVRGIGKSTIEKIEELINTGKCEYYEQLKSSIPKGVLDLISIPGVGPSTAARLYRELNIDSLEALQGALEKNAIRNLKGMGEKTEAKIKAGLEALIRHRQIRLMGYVLPIVTEVVNFIKNSNPECARIEISGDLRRRKETVKNGLILASCPDIDQVRESLLSINLVEKVCDNWTSSEGFIKILGDTNVKLKFVPKENFSVNLLLSTGSEGHINKLKEREKELGVNLLSELLHAEDEHEIYNMLGLPFIVPELREGKDEIQAAIDGELPSLIEIGDIRGDLHVHSNWSDGHNTIEAMAKAARERGYEYIAFCDHSLSSKIANGLDVERILNKMIELREVNERLENIELLMGAEVDILKDGRLDYPESILEKLDVVIASVHSGFNMDEASMTKRLITAIENPFVHAIGHPTGRLLGRRDPYPVNMDAVIEAVSEHGKAIELNAYPDRLDVNDVNARKAKQKNVKIMINTDAHSIADLDFMIYGVYTARRGWIEPKDVINTMNLESLLNWLTSFRQR